MHEQDPNCGGSLEQDIAVYLNSKKRRLTDKSKRGYDATLGEFIRFYPALSLDAFEPPAGTRLVEDFLTTRWGHRAPRTYNKNLSVMRDFFRWHVARGGLARDPMINVDRAKPRAILRSTYSDAERRQILAANPDSRDQVALRLLLDYGIRKGALQNVRFEHFDPYARRIVIFTKGEKIHRLPLPDEELWHHLAELGEPGHHYLIPRQRLRRRRPPHRKHFAAADALLQQLHQTVERIDDAACAREFEHLDRHLRAARDWLDLMLAAASTQVTRFHDEQIGEHGLHDYWYRCLARAGIVAKGVTRGERMHKARHSAGQRVLDKTGNLKAAQALLCHATIGTTGDVYTGWDDARLETTMRDVIPASPGLDEALTRQLPPRHGTTPRPAAPAEAETV